jgi:hypothetical protein
VCKLERLGQKQLCTLVKTTLSNATVCDRPLENPAKVIFSDVNSYVLLMYITCRIFCAKGITVSQIFLCVITFCNVGLSTVGKLGFLDIFEV